MRPTIPLIALALLALPASALAQEVVAGRTPAGDTIALHPEGIARAIDTLPGMVREIMERSGVPGVAVAVVHGGEAVFAEGFGVRDTRTGDPVTTHTVFQIASISKPVSATVSAVAVSRGDVSWEDRVSAHLPALRFSEDYVTRNATIGDFFAHRSGLPATAGGVSSSVSDMALWMKLLLGGGTVDGRTLFEPEALLPALQPRITSAPGATVLDRSGAYGYGFNVGVTAGGRTSMSHSGGFLLGAATYFQILPGADVGIVVLSNGAPVGAVEAIGAHFMDVVQFGEPTRDWLAAYQGAMRWLFEPAGDLAGQERPGDAEPARALASYTGRYDSAYYGSAEIAEEDGLLVLTIGPDAMRFALEHWTADTFALTPRGENAPAGSLSSVGFAFEGEAAAGFRIDHLDRTGLGTWRRSDR